RQRILDRLLNDALHRPGAEHGIVTLRSDMISGRLSDLQVQIPLRKNLRQPVELQIDDLRYLRTVERMEDDSLVDAVQELRQKPSPQRFIKRFAHVFLAATLVGDLLNQLATDI